LLRFIAAPDHLKTLRSCVYSSLESIVKSGNEISIQGSQVLIRKLSGNPLWDSSLRKRLDIKTEVETRRKRSHTG